MKYRNETAFTHSSAESLGVLLVNLGTPDSPGVSDVRRYLAEFLSDPRVIEVPRLIWKAILHGVILRIRPKRSAAAYASVWSDEGSPLLAISRRQERALQQRLNEKSGLPVKVVLAMRYGNPGIAAGLETLRKANARKVLVLPLYPQYSATTTASVFDAVTNELQQWRWIPELRFINQYHDDPAYISALAESIRKTEDEYGNPDKLLFSFHGIPKEYFENGDPYFCHCQKTARLVTEELGLNKDEWLLTFQSRVGNKEWLKPYTDHQLKQWGADGVKKVHVLCPGFSADCLETLEEISVENREYFIEAGGEHYQYIPALNDSPAHIDMLSELVLRNIVGWDQVASEAEGKARAERAKAMGAKS